MISISYLDNPLSFTPSHLDTHSSPSSLLTYTPSLKINQHTYHHSSSLRCNQFIGVLVVGSCECGLMYRHEGRASIDAWDGGATSPEVPLWYVPHLSYLLSFSSLFSNLSPSVALLLPLLFFYPHLLPSVFIPSFYLPTCLSSHIPRHSPFLSSHKNIKREEAAMLPMITAIPLINIVSTRWHAHEIFQI